MCVFSPSSSKSVPPYATIRFASEKTNVSRLIRLGMFCQPASRSLIGIGGSSGTRSARSALNRLFKVMASESLRLRKSIVLNSSSVITGIISSKGFAKLRASFEKAHPRLGVSRVLRQTLTKPIIALHVARVICNYGRNCFPIDSGCRR